MDLSRDLEGQLLKRAEVADFTVSEDERSIEFPFSSEYPVARYFGNEVLQHDARSADLSRLNDSAPLLFNHDPNKVIGVVERAWIDDKVKRGYANVKFSRNAFAQEVLADVKDGVLRNVSFGYAINDMEQRGSGDFVATSWAPYEISVVSIPADPTVGVGRSFEADPAAPAASPTPQPEPEVPMENTPDVSAVRAEAAAEAAKAERARISGITALTEKHGMSDLGRQLIEGGRSLDEARAAVLDKLGAKVEPVSEKAGDIGLSAKEIREFSFQRAINALANPGDRNLWEAAAFERECSEAASKRTGKQSQGMMVPSDVLRGQRDLVVGTSTAGGNLVPTQLDTANFIDLLRNRLALANVGVTILNGLSGNLSIPRQSSASTAFWVGEGASPTESQPAIDQVSMTPKTVGAFVDYSRKLMLQSSMDVETMIRGDLARVIALEIDRVAIYGTGSTNQPLGITNTTGIGSQTITTYGTYVEYVSMETKVAVANADVASMYYIINANARGALKTTEKSAGGTFGNFAIMDNLLNGYPYVVTNQLGTNDCLFGDFSQLILGMWSGLDLTVDPYAGSTAGNVRVIALQDMDVAVRQPGAFVFGT